MLVDRNGNIAKLQANIAELRPESPNPLDLEIYKITSPGAVVDLGGGLLDRGALLVDEFVGIPASELHIAVCQGAYA